MIASFKSGRDGIADALGIDDSRFITRPWVHTETGGYIKVSITGGPDD
jgi:crossover junction endodeoxyribonuclease RusA